MTDPRSDTPEPFEAAWEPAFQQRRWLGPAALSAAVLVPTAILIFSNLDATEVSWAGFRFDQPLWAILVVTFLAGMVGGKAAGWGWRRWRRRRKRLKEELAVLRIRAADIDLSDG